MRGDHWAKWSLRNLTILFPITARESTVHPKNQKSKSPEQTPSSAGGPAQGGGRPTGLPHTWPRRARTAEGRETTQIKTHTKQEQTPETVCKTSPRHLASQASPGTCGVRTHRLPREAAARPGLTQSWSIQTRLRMTPEAQLIRR